MLVENVNQISSGTFYWEGKLFVELQYCSEVGMGFYNGLFTIFLIVIPCCGFQTGKAHLLYLCVSCFTGSLFRC